MTLRVRRLSSSVFERIPRADWGEWKNWITKRPDHQTKTKAVRPLVFDGRLGLAEFIIELNRVGALNYHIKPRVASPEQPFKVAQPEIYRGPSSNQ